MRAAKKMVGTSSGKVRRVLFLLISLVVSCNGWSQAGNYAFTTGTGAALNSMAGSTQIIGSGTDDASSAVTNIGFTFTFACTNYTQFSASSNGLMGLGGTAVSSSFSNSMTGSATYPIIAAIWDDMHTCTTGKVHYRLTGAAPNRVLTVEWLFGNYGESGGAYTKTVQVRLYETTNVVEIVYGTNGGATYSGATIGIASGSTSYQSVSTTGNTSSNTVPNDANTTLPASGRRYTFTPSAAASTYTSSTVTQQATGPILRCGTNQLIIGIQVVAAVGCSALNLTTFQLAAGSSTNLVADVTKIHIYYTGSSSTFATTNEFVAGGTTPTGATNTINGSQSLTSGTNYFWVTYDMNTGATVGNLTDASCTQLTVGGSNYAPSTTNPAGNGTIAMCVAPGGVGSGLETWLRADLGTVGGPALTGWNNQASGAATTLNGNPNIVTNNASYNYNPYIDFAGPAGTLLSGVAANRQCVLLNSYAGMDGPSYKSFFFAFQLNDLTRVNTHVATVRDVTWGFPVNGTLHGGLSGANATLMESGYDATDFGLSSAAGTWQRNQVNIGSDAVHSSTKHILSANCTSGGSTTVNAFLGGQNDDAGGGFVGHPRDWKGPAAEVIGFTNSLTATERQRVDSYLAIKYGITLPNNYLSTTGATIFTVAAPYNNNIIGIGRDDNEALTQKQSHYDNDLVRLFLGTLAAMNASNVSTFSVDNSYVVMGDNNGAHCATAASNAEMPTGLASCTLFSRLEKEWKVQRTNMAQTYNMSVSLAACGAPGSVNTAHLRLLVDDDGNFANGGTQCYYIGDGTGINFTYANPYITVQNISTTHIPNNAVKYITIASINSATPLPVQLVSFDAQLNNVKRYVDLTWTTESEINMNHFTVEKLVDNVWTELEEVKAIGQENEQTNYATIDFYPAPGINYYRLKQTENDGLHYYSEVRSVILDISDDYLQVAPNPANSSVQLIYKDLQDAQIQLIDAAGRVVKCPVQFTGDNSCTLDVEQLASGYYSVVVTGEKVLQARVLIQH